MESIYPFIRFITIDESKCSYKGEIYFKQYMKDKNKKIWNKNFFDNYYNNIYTFLYLSNKNIEFKCTFNRKGNIFQKKIKELELEKRGTKLYNIKNIKNIDLISNSF